MLTLHRSVRLHSPCISMCLELRVINNNTTNAGVCAYARTRRLSTHTYPYKHSLSLVSATSDRDEACTVTALACKTPHLVGEGIALRGQTFREY